MIVGDREWWKAALPRVITAIVYIKWRSTSKGYVTNDGSRARKVHESFLAAYSLTATEVPLLMYTWNPYMAGPFGFEDVSIDRRNGVGM